MINKDVKINFTLRAQDKALILRKAKKDGVSVGKYIRMQIISDPYGI